MPNPFKKDSNQRAATLIYFILSFYKNCNSPLAGIARLAFPFEKAALPNYLQRIFKKDFFTL
jgi:hypothetical protein